jgi:hypothetical protein
MLRIFPILLLAALLGGCLSSAPSPAPADAAPQAPPEASAAPAPDSALRESAPAWNVANWSGYLRVGAAYELPSHLDATSAAAKPAWSPSFQYEVAEVPRSMTVRLNWTADAGKLQFMVILPGDSGEYETPFADHGPLCMRLPQGTLTPGRYAIMAHSQYAIDAHLAFSVGTLGGRGRVIDEPHAAPAGVIPGYVFDIAGGGGGGSGAPETCA